MTGSRLTFTTDTQTPADLAVIIINWKVFDLLKKNLEALSESLGSSRVHVVVVDNASGDGSVERLREQFPWVSVIANDQNLGFAKAVNQGIKAAPARHVLLLNPDMKVRPDTLEKIVAYLDQHPDVGIVSGKLVREDGSIIESVRRFPTLWSQLAVLLQLSDLFPALLNRYHAKDIDLNVEQPVDSCRGSLFGISERVRSNLSGLDERYFIWFEEVDFCRAVNKLGFKIMHVPSIEAQDFVGRSFAQRDTYWKQKQWTRSMLRYFQKWHPGPQAWLIALVRPIPVTAAWLLDQWHRANQL